MRTSQCCVTHEFRFLMRFFMLMIYVVVWQFVGTQDQYTCCVVIKQQLLIRCLEQNKEHTTGFSKELAFKN